MEDKTLRIDDIETFCNYCGSMPNKRQYGQSGLMESNPCELVIFCTISKNPNTF